MLEKVLDLRKKSMFLTDTSEDIGAYVRYIASRKTSMFLTIQRRHRYILQIYRIEKTSIFLTDTSENIDAQFRYIASKKHRCFFEVDIPTLISAPQR